MMTTTLACGCAASGDASHDVCIRAAQMRVWRPETSRLPQISRLVCVSRLQSVQHRNARLSTCSHVWHVLVVCHCLSGLLVRSHPCFFMLLLTTRLPTRILHIHHIFKIERASKRSLLIGALRMPFLARQYASESRSIPTAKIPSL